MTLKDFKKYALSIEVKRKDTPELVGLSRSYIKFRDESISEEILAADNCISQIFDDFSDIDSLLVKEKLGRLQREWNFLKEKAISTIGSPIDGYSLSILDELISFAMKLEKIYSVLKGVLDNTNRKEILKTIEEVIHSIVFYITKIQLFFYDLFISPLKKRVSTEQNRVILVYNR